MMKRAYWTLAVLLLGMMASAQAEESVMEAAPQQQAEEPESATQAWLELQRSGQAASSTRQPLSGAAMDKIHERYVKSFGHPIPEHFEYDQPISK